MSAPRLTSARARELAVDLHYAVDWAGEDLRAALLELAKVLEVREAQAVASAAPSRRPAIPKLRVDVSDPEQKFGADLISITIAVRPGDVKVFDGHTGELLTGIRSIDIQADATEATTVTITAFPEH